MGKFNILFSGIKLFGSSGFVENEQAISSSINVILSPHLSKKSYFFFFSSFILLKSSPDKPYFSLSLGSR